MGLRMDLASDALAHWPKRRDNTYSTMHQPSLKEIVRLRLDNQTFCCHPSRIGSMSLRPNSGHMVRTKCSCVSSDACYEPPIIARVRFEGVNKGEEAEGRTCHIIKSLSRFTLDVRTRISSLPPSISRDGSCGGRRAATDRQVSRELNNEVLLKSLSLSAPFSFQAGGTH